MGQRKSADLATQVRAVLDALIAARFDDPAEGFDQGYVTGLDEAIERIGEVMRHADGCDCDDCTLPHLGETDSTGCLDKGLVCSIDPHTGRCTECDGQEED